MLKKVGKANKPYLSAEIVKANNSVITVANTFAPEIRPTNFGDKLHVPVICGDEEYLWTCNNTTMDSLIDILGEDETKWQGQTVELAVMPVMTNEGKKTAIYTKTYADSI